MGPKEECVLVWAVMRKEEYERVILPKGCFAQAVNIGVVGDLKRQAESKRWGAMIAMSLYSWVSKMWPELSESSLILPR